MAIEMAVRFPFWHELDQSIEVGQISDFDFFDNVPEYVADGGSQVFVTLQPPARKSACSAHVRLALSVAA
jgi:hypothetical protein